MLPEQGVLLELGLLALTVWELDLLGLGPLELQLRLLESAWSCRAVCAA